MIFLHQFRKPVQRWCYFQSSPGFSKPAEGSEKDEAQEAFHGVFTKLLKSAEFYVLLQYKNFMRAADFPEAEEFAHHDKPWLDLLEHYLFEKKTCRTIDEVIKQLKIIIEAKFNSTMKESEKAEKDPYFAKKAAFLQRLVLKLQDLPGSLNAGKGNVEVLADGDDILAKMKIHPVIAKTMRKYHDQALGTLDHIGNQLKALLFDDAKAKAAVQAWRTEYYETGMARIKGRQKAKKDRDPLARIRRRARQAAGGSPEDKNSSAKPGSTPPVRPSTTNPTPITATASSTSSTPLVAETVITHSTPANNNNSSASLAA